MVFVPQAKRNKSIRGWLLFYVILSFFGLVQSRKYFEELTFDFFLVLDIIGIGLVIYSLILIFAFNPKAPKWNIIRLWYLLTVWIISIFYLFRIGELYADEFIILLFPSLINIIWIAYWKKSKRVNETFGSNK